MHVLPKRKLTPLQMLIKHIEEITEMSSYSDGIICEIYFRCYQLLEYEENMIRKSYAQGLIDEFTNHEKKDWYNEDTEAQVERFYKTFFVPNKPIL